MAVVSLQTAIDGAVQSAITFLGGNPNADPSSTLAGDINTELGTLGFAQHVTAAIANGTLTLTLATGKTVSGSLSLDSDLGIAGLSNLLTTTGSATVSLAYSFSLTLGVGALTPTKPFVDTGAVVSVGATITTPNLSVDLGFLPFTATDKGSSLNAGFAINLTDPNAGSATTLALANLTSSAVTTTPTVAATVDLHLATDDSILSGAALPSMSADLVGTWSNGANPTLALDDVTLNLGSFVTNFIKPILDDLAPILGPVSKVTGFLGSDLTFIDDVPGLADALGGTNGHLTVLDLLGDLPRVKTSARVSRRRI